MKVIIFGATGMVGQGVLRECLLDSSVTMVQTIGRTPLPEKESALALGTTKLRQIVHSDLFDYAKIETQLTGFDACFFCLGTPSAGKSEADYTRITHDLTLAAATTLARLNPTMTFIYVSGDGADSTETSRVMWARVRGKTENDLLKLPFKAVYIFRPSVIQPLHGIRSKTKLYQFFYSATKPLLPLMRSLFPSLVSSTEAIGRKMISVARDGNAKTILKTADFN